MSYEKYFKDVSGYDVIDVYRAHRIFGLTDEVLCHASKKLLLSGVRTGGKTLEQDVKEARDSLNRWLEMLQEDLGNEQEKDGWTPEAINEAAFDTGIPVSAAFKDAFDSAGIDWPGESRIDVIGQNGNDGAVYAERALQEVFSAAVLPSWARWVAVDKDGEVYVYSVRPHISNNADRAGLWVIPGGKFKKLKDIDPPPDFTKCIWEVKK